MKFKQILFVGVISFFFGALLTTPVFAQQACPYIITKVRAQVNTSSPWSNPLSVNKDQNSTIRVVAFQCTNAEGTACDTVGTTQIRLVGAGLDTVVNASQSSIPTVTLLQTGTIQVTATTFGYTGAGCTDTMTITVTGAQQNPVCGNGTCETGETTANCSSDCKAAAVCGNGVCETGETTTNCSADCKVAAVCGNKVCEVGETTTNCSADCKPATQLPNTGARTVIILSSIAPGIMLVLLGVSLTRKRLNRE